MISPAVLVVPVVARLALSDVFFVGCIVFTVAVEHLVPLFVAKYSHKWTLGVQKGLSLDYKDILD
jgi:hypothetical protein